MGRLFLFNPDCEMSIANGGIHYTPSSNIVQMMEDLALLPLWMTEEGDAVLQMGGASQALEGKLQPKGKIVTGIPSGIYQPFPWGWSPKTAHSFARLGMCAEWEAVQKEWYSRRKTVEIISRLKERIPALDRLAPARICRTLDEVSRAVASGSFVAKAPWSSSGKGILFLNGGLNRKEEEWLGGILKRQGYLMLEERLERTGDFAMEFDATQEEISFMGWSLFETSATGEYLGNFLGRQDELESLIAGFEGQDMLDVLKEEMPRTLREVYPDYRGWLGVDMMGYRDPVKGNCIQPCVEVNLRCNMGIVALIFCRNHLWEGSRGRFSIRFHPEGGQALHEHNSLLEKYPPIYQDNRIKSGYLNLVPVTGTTKFVASVLCY